MYTCDNCSEKIELRRVKRREVPLFAANDDAYLFCSEKCAEAFMAKYVLPRMEVEDD